MPSGSTGTPTSAPGTTASTAAAIPQPGDLKGLAERWVFLRDNLNGLVLEFKGEVDAWVKKFDGYYAAHPYHAQFKGLDVLLAKQERLLQSFFDEIAAQGTGPNRCSQLGQVEEFKAMLFGQIATIGQQANVAPGTMASPAEGNAGDSPDAAVARAEAGDALQDIQMDRTVRFGEALTLGVGLYENEIQFYKDCQEQKWYHVWQMEKTLHSSAQTLAEFVKLLKERFDVDKAYTLAAAEHLDRKAAMIRTLDQLIGLSMPFCSKGGA